MSYKLDIQCKHCGEHALDLKSLVADMRSLGVSHARIGDVELWLDPVRGRPGIDVDSRLLVPTSVQTPPPVEADGIVWTEDEQELIP